MTGQSWNVGWWRRGSLPLDVTTEVHNSSQHHQKGPIFATILDFILCEILFADGDWRGITLPNFVISSQCRSATFHVICYEHEVFIRLYATLVDCNHIVQQKVEMTG